MLLGYGIAAKRLADSRRLVNEDVAMAMEITAVGEERPSQVLFAWFTLLSGQSRPRPASQAFVDLLPAVAGEPGDCHELVLHLNRQVFIKMVQQLRAHVHRQYLGAFGHVTEQQLAAKSASIVGVTGRDASSVRILRFAHNDVTPELTPSRSRVRSWTFSRWCALRRTSMLPQPAAAPGRVNLRGVGLAKTAHAAS